MTGWLRSLVRWWQGRLPSPASPSRRSADIPAKFRRGIVKRHETPGEIPPMHWTPCHPSTRDRFKAEMTCPHGHGLTLRSHRIDASGDVWPSVVCPGAGCTYHEFVRLEGWTFGAVPRARVVS